VVPVINQIELHPQFQQKQMRAFHQQHKIVTESWSPLGRGAALKHKTITELAARHQKTPAQIVLRWHMELGLVAIPKSVTPSRIQENLGIFDFSLSEDDLAAISALDTPNRIGFDPNTFG
jgi:Aldo/keto reductases, related to diketogulonate reductase